MTSPHAARQVTRTERGWAGHFICGTRCWYHRNTLVSLGDKHIVVSSVGNFHPKHDGAIGTIGAFGRYYETMVFRGKREGAYIEADVKYNVSVDETLAWSICAKKASRLPEDADLTMDAQHEAVVQWIANHFELAYRSRVPL